ncbi:MAG: NTP transferase domain-containing protein [Candidatus Omnitrophica bacterium]|nr:NTP transferase domain-containing protein [Candidatus Omnitrophota bacterium]
MNISDQLAAVILAAGQGTRMNSQRPKVLHKLGSKPMLGHVMDTVTAAGVRQMFVVTGFRGELVAEYVGARARCVPQPNLLGTGDAVWQVNAEPFMQRGDTHVLVIYGDTPLITPQTVAALIEEHRRSNSLCTLLSAVVPDPTGYGRIIRDERGKITAIVEEQDAQPIQKAIQEVNVGAYVFKAQELFAAIQGLKPANVKKEYYLTDVIAVFARNAYPISHVRTEDVDEMLGINSRAGLVKAFAIYRRRIIEKIIAGGVTVVDPHTTYIDDEVRIGQDTVIYPLTVIERDVEIGQGCAIGPFCHVRAGCRIADNVSIGNFAEINRSAIGKGTRIKHQSYIGDAQIAAAVNIGAGTIIANYDGKNKHKTVIETGAFIGTGTILVAPVKIGKAAVTGAGAVVPKNKKVEDHQVVVGIPARLLRKNEGPDSCKKS